MQLLRVGSQMPQIAQRSPHVVLVTLHAATNPPSNNSPEIQSIAFRRNLNSVFKLRDADKGAPWGGVFKTRA
jgi:hypothetical protein